MAASVVSVSKRLLGELKDYAKDPHECLEELAPVGDDLLHWTAIMKGVQGTAYEREFPTFRLLPTYPPPYQLLVVCDERLFPHWLFCCVYLLLQVLQ